jgi:hypothetical protein
MKQKLLLIATAFVFSQVTNAQVFTSDFETWTSGMPDGWGGSATQLTNLTVSESTDAYSGSKSCQLEVTGTSHRRFSTTSINVTNETVYQISFWAKGQGEIRTGLLLEPTTYQTYNSYIQVNSGSWTNYTQNITAGGTGSAQFILSLINTVATDHIIIDDLIITEEGSVDPVEPELTSIYDIQYTTEVSGDSPLVGQEVITSGIVTGTYQSGTNYGYFLQDGEGAWNGIHVFLGTTDTRPTIGDELQITGTVAEFNNLTQLTFISETIELSTGNTLPTATVISTADINTEMYEGVLVKVEGAQCTNVNSGFGMWEITAGGNAAKVHNLMYSFTPTLNTIYNITGVINYSFSEFRICPRSANDITNTASINEELTNSVKFYPNPSSDFISIENALGSTVTISNALGQVVKQTKIENQIEKVSISNLNSGVYFITFMNGQQKTTQRLVVR